MPAAQRSSGRDRRLTTAGLIAVSAATLLMLAWAVFPTAALAVAVTWGGNGSDNLPCSNGAHWVLSGGGPTETITAAVLHIDGATFPMSQSGNGSWSADSTGPLDGSENIFVDVTGNPGKAHLQLSHCLSGGTTTTTTTTTSPTTTTTTPTTTTTTTKITKTTTTTTPTTTTTTPTTTTTSPTTTTTSPTKTTTTTTPTTTTTTPTTTTPVTTTTTTSPTTTTRTTTTTTTGSPTVSPTSITSTSTRTTTRTSTPVVAPTTIRPSGTAFTGIENVVPLGVVALMLMTGGSGLLWAGSRRRRDEDDE